MSRVFHTSQQSWFLSPPAPCFCNLNLFSVVVNVSHATKSSLEKPWNTFYAFSLRKHIGWLLFGPFYELYAAKLHPEIKVLVPSRKMKWRGRIASQTHHGDIKGVCNGIVVFIPEIAAGARLASQLLFHLISDLKRRVCVCVPEKYTQTHACTQKVCLRLTVHVCVCVG